MPSPSREGLQWPCNGQSQGRGARACACRRCALDLLHKARLRSTCSSGALKQPDPFCSRALPYLAFLSLLPQVSSELLLCARLLEELATWSTVLPLRASQCGGRDRQTSKQPVYDGGTLRPQRSPGEAWRGQRRFPEDGQISQQKAGDARRWSSAWRCSPGPCKAGSTPLKPLWCSATRQKMTVSYLLAPSTPT